MSDIPSTIRAVRLAAGLTQRQLGETLGYIKAAQVIVADWESGKRPVPRSKITLLADILGVPIRDLLP